MTGDEWVKTADAESTAALTPKNTKPSEVLMTLAVDDDTGTVSCTVGTHVSPRELFRVAAICLCRIAKSQCIPYTDLVGIVDDVGQKMKEGRPL